MESAFSEVQRLAILLSHWTSQNAVVQSKNILLVSGTLFQIECVFTDRFDGCGDMNVLQLRTPAEGIISNLFNAIGDFDAGQFTATEKRVVSNFPEGTRERDFSEGDTAFKCCRVD
jgi:hypothetical protein